MIFNIAVEEIQALTDEQAREVVARLCRAELRKRNLPSSAVTWGGDQRAKDGGIDVRVSLPELSIVPELVLAPNTGFQVKAEPFPPSSIGPEMAPKGVIRPTISELSELNGAYIIVSTQDNTSDLFRKSRIEAMTECLKVHGLEGKIIVEFYDARKIADWTETHPAIASWVKHIIGKPIVGWRPYGPWAYKEATLEPQYLIDDQVKIFTPDRDDGVNVSQAIAMLRKDLSRNAAVRLIGLSGVGKTRLVQALFDQRVVTAVPELEPENVIYTDLSDSPQPQPSHMLGTLLSEGADCVVVVDNCGPDMHQRLTEIVKQPGSSLRLITIEYDVRDDLPEATSLYRLQGSSPDTIKELLRRKHGILSATDIDTIADFSDGNARVAFALASTATATDELGRLRDEDLFSRLFVQKNSDNEELLRCAEAISLLYSFNGEDTSTGSELIILSDLAGVKVEVLFRHLADLQRRGLLQQRGVWRALLPHAIANRLAIRAFESIPNDKIVEALNNKASERVARSFSRRLGYLHSSMKVQALANEWQRVGGRLSDVKNLNTLGREIFANLAPINPEATLVTLDAATVDADFVSTANTTRIEFIGLARQLAYEPTLFDRAAQVLLRFALAEPEEVRGETSTEFLSSLFHVHLSGTHAAPEQRASFLNQLFESENSNLVRVGFALLRASLQTRNFTTLHSFDFGTRKRDYGWWPRSRKDLERWYNLFIDVAVKLSRSTSVKIKQQAKLELGEAVRGLISDAGMTQKIAEVAEQMAVNGGWTEGWLGIRRVLQWDMATSSKDLIDEVRKIEAGLAPVDLKNRIAAKVLARGSFADDLDDEDEGDVSASRYERAPKEAEELGKQAADSEVLLLEFLGDLLSDKVNSKFWNFGFGVGCESKEVGKILSQARDTIRSLEPGGFSLMFVRGLIAGWMQSDPSAVSTFLDKAIEDEVWASRFPEIQLAAKLDEEGYHRILRSIEIGHAPTWQYTYVATARNTDPLTVQQILPLVLKISEKSDRGLEVAIDLLAMTIHCANEKDEQYKAELRGECLQFLLKINWENYPVSDENTDHDMSTVINFSLRGAAFSKNVADLLANLVSLTRQKRKTRLRNRIKLLSPFFASYPLEALDAVFVPDEDGQYRSALSLISDPYREDSETAIKLVPDEELIKWCEKSPKERYAFAARSCALFENANGGEATDVNVAPIAVKLVKCAPDAIEVLEIFAERLHPHIWSGPRSQVLKRRVKQLLHLNPQGDAKLQAAIESTEQKVLTMVARLEQEEEREERSRTESFE